MNTKILSDQKFDKEIQVNFARGFNWNLGGSILYEIAKTIHLFFLLRCADSTAYGIIGSIFSLCYFSTFLIDLGATNSLPPIIGTFSQSKETFKKLILNYYLIPFFPAFLVVAGGALWILSHKTITASTMGLYAIIPCIILLECLRSFLRFILHLFFKTKSVIIFEISLLAMYFSSIWISYLGFHVPITPYLVFIPHCTDSIAGVTFCIVLLYRYYKKLPDTAQPLPEGLFARVVSLRWYNYLLRISRHLFTSGILTPFFAYKFGFQVAGLYYFANTFACSLQSIIKSIMVYSGNAFLANVKDCSLEVKKYAFGILSKQLTTVVAPVIIIFLININNIFHLTQTHDATNTTLAFILIFMLITTTEFFLVLYEQFYIIEEASRKIFFLKALEMLLFFVTIKTMSDSITSILFSIVIIRSISFFIIAFSAYFTWGIKPNFKPSPKVVLSSFALAVIVAYLLR